MSAPRPRRPNPLVRRLGAIGRIAVALAAALGCDSPPDDVPLWQPPPGAHAYHVTVTLAAEGSGADEIPAAFGLQMYASPSTGQLIIWDGSSADQPEVVREGESQLTVKSAFFRLRVPRWTPTVELSHLMITIDARPDGLAGTLEGGAVVFHGDVGNGFVPIRGTLVGTLDRQAPHIFGVDRESRSHPLAGVTLRASEPLAPDVALDLRGDDGLVIPFATSQVKDFTPVFTTDFTATGILRFGRRYRVVARAPIRDLAGNVSRQPLPTIETLPDPGWFDDPGFEGQPRALYRNCGVGPSGITGLRALWMWKATECFPDSNCDPEPAASFTARMRVPAGASTLRLSWRALRIGMTDDYQVSYDDSQVILAVPGLGTSGALFGKIDEPFTPIGDNLRASSPHELAVPLPAEATDEIVVLIAPGPRPRGNGGAALQIDDLHID